MSKLPSPHGDKLIALLENGKLPKGDVRGLSMSLAPSPRWAAS